MKIGLFGGAFNPIHLGHVKIAKEEFQLLFKKATWKHSLVIGFGMSLFIEVVQYFIMRNSAVDDVILNNPIPP